MALSVLRSMARDARDRHRDDEVAGVLDGIADKRAAALRERSGGPGWLHAADVPDGVVFVAAARPKGVRWRRDGTMCRSLLPYGSGRLVSPASVDASTAADGGGYVEVRP